LNQEIKISQIKDKIFYDVINFSLFNPALHKERKFSTKQAISHYLTQRYAYEGI